MKQAVMGLYWLAVGAAVGVFALSVFQYALLFPDPVLAPVKQPASGPGSSNDGGREPSSEPFHSVPSPPVDRLVLVQRNQSASKTPDAPKDRPDLSEESIQKIQESRLPYELVGTSNGTRPYEYAMVRYLENKKVRPLKPGQTWNDLKVLTVAEEWIEIRNQKKKKKELLRLKRSVQSPLSSPRSSKDRNITQVSRYQINEAIHNNMNNLLAAVEAGPVMRRGNVVGFKLRSFRGKPGKLLKKLGFREGDLILRVNGKRVNSMQKAFQLWTQLKNKQHFRIDIERDGEVRTLEYSLVR